MSTELTRRNNPLAEMLDWFETGAPFTMRGLGLTPQVRVEDFVEDDTYVVRAELPGMDPDKDIEITVSGDTLTIRGSRREEKVDKQHREMHYGAFHRRLTLPNGVKGEDVTATYDAGVLEVRMPMPKSPEETRHISVQKPE